MPGTAIVAIGRNEGERLQRCLNSAGPQADVVVYVDSGSTDNSVEFARSLGCEVVILDPSIPFTASRARNAGLERVSAMERVIEYVQFVDGDCEIRSDWVMLAVDFLNSHPEVAAVCGRRRELYPADTIYNQLCDWEWEIEPGPAKYCGGDVMMRVDALTQVNGYRGSLIAGEEPELCVRLRAAGWRIYILDAEMTLHDAAMTHFEQWWKRMKRSGYAYAAGAWLHGTSPERHWVRQTARPWIWVCGPIALLTAISSLVGPAGLGVLLIYPAQILRLALKNPGTIRDRFIAAVFNTLARFPEFSGQLQFLRDLVKGNSQIIEYK